MERGEVVKSATGKLGVHFSPSDSASRLNKGEDAGRLLPAISDELRRWAAQAAGRLWFHSGMMPKSRIAGRAHRLSAVPKLVLLMFSIGGACGWFAASAHATVRGWTGAASALWSNPNNWYPAGIPQNGDNVSFGFLGGESNTSNTNDLSGLVVADLGFQNRSFQINGNAITVTNWVQNYPTYGTGNPSYTTTINCPLIFSNTYTYVLTGNSPGQFFQTTLDIHLNGPITVIGTLNLDADASGVDGGGNGNIYVAGVISGSGDVGVGANNYEGNVCTVHFDGAEGNTFTGRMYVNYAGPTSQIFFNKQSGTTVNGGLVAQTGLPCAISLANSGQIGANASIIVTYGTDLILNGSATASDVLLTNYSSDAKPSMLDMGGNTLTLLGNITASSANGAVTPAIKGQVALSVGAHTFTMFNPAYAGLDMQAQLSGTGGFTKRGSAALLLDASNSFSGVVTANAGNIDVYDAHGLGTTAGQTILQGSGSLTLHGISIAGEQLTVQGQSQVSSDTAGSLLITVGTCSWTGPIELDTNLVVVADNVSLTGQISGTGGLEFLMGDALLGGSAANTFTGTTHAENSLLQFDKPAGVAAFAGPLIVGTSGGSPCEARWLNNLQGVNPAVTVYAGSLVNLTNHNESFSALTYNGGDVETGAGLLTLPSTITSLAASSTAKLNGNAIISRSGLTFNVADGAANPDLSVGAVISDSSIVPVTKLGAGELALSGANTYRGSTLIGEGLLMALNDAALGSATVGTVVSNGATLEVDNRSQNFSEGLNLAGAGRGGTNGALYCLSSSTISSPIFLTAPATIRSDETGSEFLLLSTITGTGPLTTVGAGRTELGGTQNNTYSGDTDASQGTLWLAKGGGAYAIPNNLVIGTRNRINILGTSATVASLAYYQINGSLVTVNGGSLFDVNNYAESIGEVILNSGGNVHTGAGSLLLAGSAGTVVSVDPGISSASLISGNLNLFTGGTFYVGSAQTPPLSGAPPLDVQASVSQTTVGGVTKLGPGEMRLSGNNSFTGGLFINQGVLSVSNDFALGAVSGSTTVNTNGTLELLNGRTIGNETLTLNSSNSPALWCPSGSNTWSGPIVLSQTAAIDVDPADGYLQLSNVVSGPGGLTKLGLGTLQFTGSVSNGYGGPTTIQGGVVSAGRAGVVSIPSDVIIGDDSATNVVATLSSLRDAQFNRYANMTVNNSGELNLVNTSGTTPPDEHVASLNGKGVLNLAAGTRLIVTNEVPCEFFGPVTGHGFFSKNGTAAMTVWGNWTLTTDSHDSLDIIEGDFIVNGTISSGTNEVYTGARLRGGGRLTGGVGVDSGGTIYPSSKVPGGQGGPLEIGALTLHSGATAVLDFYGSSPNGGNDELIVDGTVALNPGHLTATFHYPPHNGDVFMLLNKTTSGLYSQFAGLGNGVHQFGDYAVLVSYAGGDGNDLIFTVTNAPADFFNYRLAEGNGNQTVEPNECNLLYVSVVNLLTSSITITNATLRATNASGVIVTIPQAAYPVISAGQSAENLTPFQFRTDTNLACGGTVGFELVLGIVNEGDYTINFSPVSGNDCTHPTGPCQSCTVASWQFTTNTPTTLAPLLFSGAPSTCFPGKAYPGTNATTNLPPTPFLTHSFTNSTTNQLCITAQLDFGCPTAPTNALGVAAYLGTFDTNNPAAGYLGDGGAGGPPYPAFSFQVPAGTNFTLVVMAQATNLTCHNYALELFGLPCAPPVLAIANELAPAKVRVNWSTAYPGFTAQQSGTPGGTYSNLTQTPVILNSRYALTNITTTTNQFYRLKK